MNSMPPDRRQPPFLKGTRLYLRSLQCADIDGEYPGWLNDQEVCRGNAHHIFPYTAADAKAFVANAAKDRSRLILAIVLVDGNRHIGNIALNSISRVNRSADLAILIGDKASWGQGYAFEASRLLMQHAFMRMGIRRITCGTFLGNTAMMRLADKLGMREEGRRRQAVFKNGMYVDVIEYGILRDEFDYQGNMN